jgi:hypothetical protein
MRSVTRPRACSRGLYRSFITHELLGAAFPAAVVGLAMACAAPSRDLDAVVQSLVRAGTPPPPPLLCVSGVRRALSYNRRAILCACECVHQADLCMGAAYSVENLAPFVAGSLHLPAGAALDGRLTDLLQALRSDLLLKQTIATSLHQLLLSVCASHGVVVHVGRSVPGNGAAERPGEGDVKVVAADGTSVSFVGPVGEFVVVDPEELTALLSLWTLSPFVVPTEVQAALQLAEALTLPR